MRVSKHLAQETLDVENTILCPFELPPQTTFLFFISCREGREEAAIGREIRRFKSRLE